MTRKGFIRLSQAFNATCLACAIDGQPLSQEQKQIIFDQLALACDDLSSTQFAYGRFEDACKKGFSNSQVIDAQLSGLSS